MALSAEQILARDDTISMVVHVPEWADATGDDAVKVVLPDVTAENAIAAQMAKNKDKAAAGDLEMACRLAWCLRDVATGNPVFTVQQAKQLLAKKTMPIMRVQAALIALQKQTNEQIQELVKNFETTAAGDSGTDSPSTKDTPTRT